MLLIITHIEVSTRTAENEGYVLSSEDVLLSSTHNDVE